MGLKIGASVSVTIKLFAIGFLLLVLLIPQAMISGVVYERRARRDAAAEEIASGWGGAQTIAGPVVRVPYYSNLRDTSLPDYKVLHTQVLLPDSLAVTGSLRTEIRYRGIYEVPLYRSDLVLEGTFDGARFAALAGPHGKVLWDRAEVSLGVSDVAGVARMTWDSAEIEFLPGARERDGFLDGFAIPPGELGPDSAGLHRFRIPLPLNGSREIRFLPLGKFTTVDISSTWPHPDFVGRFLPSSREIGPEGFHARWERNYLSRGYPQEWVDRDLPGALASSSFGVQLYSPIDFYQQCDRATKYASMFLVLTFGAFFLFEVLLKLRIHPIQYLLVGFAMALFYLLLISLSEQIGFLASYAIASGATVGLIAAYSATILGERRRAGVIAALLAALYLYLYVLLQIQDYALLIGSIGLFGILGAVMYLTRNVAWYGEKGPEGTTGAKE